MVLNRLVLFAFLSIPLSAQISNPGVIYVSAAPSGSCTAGATLRVVIGTGVIYSCQSGAWGAVTGGSGGSGTVTNTTGALTDGFMTIGNGGADIKTSSVDYGVTTAQTLSVPGSAIIYGGAATDNDGIVFELKSSNADQTGNAFVNSSSESAYTQLVTGSNSAIQGFVYANDVNGAVSPFFTADDATHPKVVMTSLGIYGWSANSSDPTASASDTGLSRGGADIINVGNGMQGSTSGTMNAAVFNASGTITANEVVANDFIGALNGVAIGGTPPVTGNVLLATDPTHAIWSNNSPTGTGFWTSTNGVRDSAARSIMPQDLPSTISSDTTGNANTASAFNHTPTSCQPVSGVTTYPTGIDSQGNGTGCSSPTGSGQPGSVTTITVDDIPGIADTTVATPSTTPHVSFTLFGAPAHSFWGNNTDTEDGPVGYSNITVDDLPEEIAGTQAHNMVWASPNAINGNPSFRALVPTDINGLPAINAIMNGSTQQGALSFLSSTGNLTLTSASNLDFSTQGNVREMQLDSSGNLHYGVNLGVFMDTNRNITPATGTFSGNVTAPLFIGNIQGGISGNQSANSIYAGPSNGSSAPAGFRTMVSADIPSTIAANTTGTAAGLSQNIAESQVTGLVNDLALKAPLDSPSLTGVPTAPTAASNANTAQIATTAMVQAAIASETPVTEIFGQVTIDVGQSEGNDSSHTSISVSSVCVASAMNPISSVPANPSPWNFLINVSQSNISIIAQSGIMLQKQVYSYMCRP